MVPFFYIGTKFTLKNRVTTVHLLQCKTNLSTYASEGEIYGKLKAFHLGKPSAAPFVEHLLS